MAQAEASSTTCQLAPFLLVSMATVPPRFGDVPRALRGLAGQSLRPSLALVLVARHYDNFVGGIDTFDRARFIPAQLPFSTSVFSDFVDAGPISKLVGALKFATSGQVLTPSEQKRTVLVTIDDDMDYPSRALETLAMWAAAIAFRSRTAYCDCSTLGALLSAAFCCFVYELCDVRARVQVGCRTPVRGDCTRRRQLSGPASHS